MDSPIAMVVAGLLAGAVSGMGIGGGSLLILVLVGFFGVEQLVAQGINLLYFLPTAATALIIHIQNKRIDWKVALFAGIPGTAVAVVASLFAVSSKPEWLKTAFGVLVLITGVMEFFKKDDDEKEDAAENKKAPQKN